jgi:gliding-associated putative ABC transporter substrate-binding component GldG
MAQMRTKRNSIAAAVIVLLILVVVNFIGTRRFLRVDLTENKVYTLSESSKRVMGRLDDLVTVRAYFSEKLPPYLLKVRQQVQDLLEEYRNYSGGNLKVEFIDPANDPEVESQLAQLGIPKLQMNILQKDKLEVVGGFLGLGFFFEDRTEAIPIVENMETLEYDITSKILKVSMKTLPRAGFVLKGGEHGLDRDLTLLRRALSESYEVVEVTPEDSIPAGLGVLLVLGMETLTEGDLFAIDQYLMRGGNTVVLAPTVKIGQAMSADPVEGDNLELLEAYGVRVNRDLVMDRSNEVAPFSSGYVNYYLSYPLWVKIRPEGFGPESQIVNRLESLVLPWTSSLSVIADTLGDVEVQILANTTPYGWTQSAPFQLNPNALPPPVEETHPETLAVLLRGSFESAYADSGPPEGIGAEVIPSGPAAQMVVLGSSMFVMDNFISSFQENLVFVQNVLDWMSLGDELIEIRSKKVTDRPLKSLSATAKNLFKFGNVAGVSVLLVLFGLYQLYRRKREKRVS